MGEASYKSDTLPSSERSASSSSSSPDAEVGREVCIVSPAVNLNTASAGAEASVGGCHAIARRWCRY